MILNFTGKVRAPKGDTYIELPDGFDVTASTRSRLRAISWGVYMTIFPMMLGLQISEGEAVTMDALGIVVLASLIVTPFLVMRLVGRVRLTLRGDELRIFSGVGSIGLRHLVSWSQIRSVEEIYVSGKWGGHWILLKGASDVQFGKLLGEKHRFFIVQVLQRELAKSGVVAESANSIDIAAVISPPKGVIYYESDDGFDVKLSTHSNVCALCIFLLGAFLLAIFRDSWIFMALALVFLIPLLALVMAGHARLHLSGGVLTVFIGVGPIGWSRRADWKSVEEVHKRSTYGGDWILIRGVSDIKFGGALGNEGRAFVLQLLQRELAKKRS